MDRALSPSLGRVVVPTVPSVRSNYESWRCPASPGIGRTESGLVGLVVTLKRAPVASLAFSEYFTNLPFSWSGVA